MLAVLRKVGDMPDISIGGLISEKKANRRTGHDDEQEKRLQPGMFRILDTPQISALNREPICTGRRLQAGIVS